MLQHDGSPPTGPDHAGVHVTSEIPAYKRLPEAALLCQLPCTCPHREVSARHRYHIVHLISIVEIHGLGDGTQPVLGIKVSVPVNILPKPPLVREPPFREVGTEQLVDIGEIGRATCRERERMG